MFDGWFDIRSGHIHFQGQYFLHFSPSVCIVFFEIFISLVVFVFNSFLFIIFSATAPGISVLRGSPIPCRITGA